MNDSEPMTTINRRQVLGAGLAAGVVGVNVPARAADTPWNHETDVVCVGSGGAACSAAVAAMDKAAAVILVERLPVLGGTTGKSGGALWIPNNFLLRAQGIDDKREDCLRYMARYSYPQIYTPNSPTLGLPADKYRLLEAYYDNASQAIDRLQELGVIKFREFRMYALDTAVPDYAEHLPEDKVKTGRCIEPLLAAGVMNMGGQQLIAEMEKWLRARNVPILTDTRATALIRSGDRVIGIEAQSGTSKLRIRARRAVVFATGGFAHNTALVGLHQTALYGSCARTGSTGDFIGIASTAGAEMGCLSTAWRTEVLFEEALENRAIGVGTFFLPGDSMILVNKYGRRVVDEKRSYNDRTHVHFTYDPTREEYPNQLLLMIFDERSLVAYGGSFPFPEDKRDSRFLIEGRTFEELAAAIAARLQTLADKSGGVALDASFGPELKATVTRFNQFAREGRDKDFDRGLHEYDRVWNPLFSAYRPGTKFPKNNMPNSTMYPFAKEGPYYAYILAAGALDTNGGPLINEKAQILQPGGVPIPGLYGAGNCIASPSRAAYWGGGCTIGLAVTFGHIAGRNAAGETPV